MALTVQCFDSLRTIDTNLRTKPTSTKLLWRVMHFLCFNFRDVTHAFVCSTSSDVTPFEVAGARFQLSMSSTVWGRGRLRVSGRRRARRPTKMERDPNKIPGSHGIVLDWKVFPVFARYMFVNWNRKQDEGHLPRDWKTEQACFQDDLPPMRFPLLATCKRTLCYFTNITFSYMQAKEWCSLWSA